MPVLPRRRDKVRQSIEELKRREFDDTVGSRPRGLPPTAPPDPVGGFVPREHVADASDPAVRAAAYGQPFEREGRPCTVSEKMLEVTSIASGRVEKWHDGRWVDITKPATGSPQELLRQLALRVIRPGDQIRWVQATKPGRLTNAFALLGWDGTSMSDDDSDVIVEGTV
jgi:hypothetical protein